MNIGELAEQTGLTRSRIRFYESKGLLKLVSRQGNGYRHYESDAVLVLKLITNAQQAGFSLSDIARVLPADLDGGSWRHDEMVSIFRQKISDINVMIEQLEASRRNLEALVERIENKPEGMDCDENARAILSAIDDRAAAE